MRKRFMGFLQCSVLILWFGIPVAGQGGAVNELKKEIETLKQGQEAIQKDLQEIKDLLSKTGLEITDNIELNIADAKNFQVRKG